MSYKPKVTKLFGKTNGLSKVKVTKEQKNKGIGKLKNAKTMPTKN